MVPSFIIGFTPTPDLPPFIIGDTTLRGTYGLPRQLQQANIMERGKPITWGSPPRVLRSTAGSVPPVADHLEPRIHPWSRLQGWI